MKKALTLLLIFSLLLSGCQFWGESIKDPVTFYYVRSDYEYFSTDGVIASEPREASGHRNDLPYLLAMYMMGPAEDDLQSPLPDGVALLKTDKTEDEILIQIADHDAITDASFTLSCACLALTCFDVSDVSAVTITSGERTITMHRDTIYLFDGSFAAEESP